MTTAVLPGSFDPPTIGHLDLIRRAARLADDVVVAVGTNPAKTPRFTPVERVAFLREALGDLEGVRVGVVEGLLVDFCRAQGATLVVKGIRDAADISWETTQATVNREIGGVETVFLPTRPELMHVSSSIVKELASWGLDVSRYVPPAVARALADNGGAATGAANEGGHDV